MKPFQLFGPDHLCALVALALCCVVAYRAGHSRWAPRLNLAGGLLFVGYAVFLNLWRLRDGFQSDLDLPLFLCDLIFFLCIICFWRIYPLVLTLATFWGLSGTLPAMITPDVATAFPSREFILFFIGHSVIVVGIWFLLGKAPESVILGWKGVGVAYGGLLAYTLIMGCLDWGLGWNYGYLMEKPRGASVLDHFGAWPYYLVGTLLLALVLFVALSWALKALLSRSRTEPFTAV